VVTIDVDVLAMFVVVVEVGHRLKDSPSLAFYAVKLEVGFSPWFHN